MKLILITTQSSTINRRLHSFKFSLVNKSHSQHSVAAVLIIKTVPQHHGMTSLLKLLHYTSRTRTLRYALRSREIYTEEPITSPEILSEPRQMQDESINSIKETPNSQFRLVLLVTTCMPCMTSTDFPNAWGSLRERGWWWPLVLDYAGGGAA